MIKTVFMGTPEFAIPILETLYKMSDVQLVVTQPDRLVGRKKTLTFSPIKKLAIEKGIPVFQPIKIREDYEEIKRYKPDLIVTCAYGQIIPKEILDIPRLGCINVHASLLPKYRGGAPIHYAIMNGEEKTGITIMYMDTSMDTGDIIKMREIPILEEDNVFTMHQKLSQLGANLLEEVLPKIIDGTNERIKQNHNDASYAPTIKREDERLDFHDTAIHIHNKVRAYNSWPLANFLIENEEFKVIEGYIGEDTKEEASKICKIKKDAIGISCTDKIYYVTKIKPFGKKEMLVQDYLNGVSKEKLMNQKIN